MNNDLDILVIEMFVKVKSNITSADCKISLEMLKTNLNCQG